MTSHPTSAEVPKPASLDLGSVLHPFGRLDDDRPPVVMARGEGVWIEDSLGKRYLDGSAGLWCVNVGYGRHEIVEAISRQAETLPFFHTYANVTNEPSARLARRILGHAPDGLGRVFFSNSGSEANDTAIKLVWHYNIVRGRPEKLKIIARRRGFHGSTIGAGSLTGMASLHQDFNLPIPEVRHVSAPDLFRGKPEDMSERAYSERLATELDDLIRHEGPETIGAFIAEPVMGSGGVVVPPEGYFEAIEPVLRRHDVLLIADEVMTGFGRLGAWFGSSLYGLKPDLMTIAKGLTSGYLPMSACVIGEHVFEEIVRSSRATTFAHGFTYSGHPVAAAAANANLDIIEREGLVARADAIGSVMKRRLEETFARHPLVGDIRGRGLMLAIELVRDRASKRPFPESARVGPRVQQRCLEAGLLLRARAETNTLCFSPALTIGEDEIEILIERLATGLRAATDDFRRDGTLRD